MTSYQNFKVKKIKTDQIHLTKATVSSSHVGIATNDDIVVMGREQHSVTGDSVKPFVQMDIPIRINNGAIFDLENEYLADPNGEFPGCIRFLNLASVMGGTNLYVDPVTNQLQNVASGKIHKDNIVPIVEEDVIDWTQLVPQRYSFINNETDAIYLGLIADDVAETTGIEETILRNKEGEISNFDDRALLSLMVRELGRLRRRLLTLEGV